MASDVRCRALVLTGFGLNCEAETASAFAQAGAEAKEVHLNDLLDGRIKLDEFHVLTIIGGFSFGDHLGGGTVLANRIRCRLWEPLTRFVADGKLVLGICNGFQTLARLGLLPGLEPDPTSRQIALGPNDRGLFHDGWVTLGVDPESPCVFLSGIQRLELPVRHGEGKLLCGSPETRSTLEELHLVPLRYLDPATGEPTRSFPENPNGSELSAGGVCNPTGRIFGLMPHPEAFLYPWNHPQWTRRRLSGELPEHGQGLAVFENAVRFVEAELL